MLLPPYTCTFKEKEGAPERQPSILVRILTSSTILLGICKSIGIAPSLLHYTQRQPYIPTPLVLCAFVTESLKAQSNSPPWAQQAHAAAPSGNSPVRTLHPQQEPAASCAAAEAGSVEGNRLAAAAAVSAVLGVVGSRSARAGAARVAAAAAAERESLGAGRVLAADRVAVAVAEGAVVRRVLGLRFVGLMAVAAVAVVAARRSRKMFGRRVAARWLGSDPARHAMARTAMMAESSAVRIGVGEAPAEVRDIAVAVEAGIAGLGFVGRVLLVLAGCTATFCSCLGTALGTVIVRPEVEDSLGSHHVLAEVAARSCQTVVRCQSSSFPFRLEDSWAQR
jgi:hypothetical protein